MRVEIPSGKELTTPPEVSFELLLVTPVAKRKQRDSRDSYLTPKYLIPEGRCCCLGRSPHVGLSIWWDFTHFCGVGDLFMLYKDFKSTGRTCIIHIQCKIWYAKQPERENGKCDTGSRTTPYYRWVRVMPQEGRKLHVVISLRETYPILRDWYDKKIDFKEKTDIYSEICRWLAAWRAGCGKVARPEFCEGCAQ